MTSKQSLLRRCLAVLSAALLAGLFAAVVTWAPAGATGTKGALRIVSVTDVGSRLPWPVQDRPFNVRVEVVDEDGRRTTVPKATKIVLKEVSGPGVLGGNTTAVIPAGGSGATILGATYSQYANGVVFAVHTKHYGVKLAPDKITVEVALTAVSAKATPGKPLALKDPNCAAPTAQVPTCGLLFLENGARGRVIMSVGSCDGLVQLRDEDRRQDCRTAGNTEALVVTAIADLKDFDGKPLYNRKSPAALVLACDKVLCGDSGHSYRGKTGHSDHESRIKVIYTLRNTGPLTKVAPPCPKKGKLGKGQEACVDYAQSHRRKGDLYLPLLYAVDLRGGFP
jgi:hypothetical protein